MRRNRNKTVRTLLANHRQLHALSLTALAAIILAGCGYSQQGLYPQNVRTVSVPIFDNHSFYQGTEFDLTEALIKEIELRTPYKVTSASNADTILQCVITSVEQARLSRQRIGSVPQELELRIAVDFRWKDLRTGQTLRQREGFEAVGRYIPTGPVSETLAVGQHAAVQRLAGQIVSVMASDW